MSDTPDEMGDHYFAVQEAVGKCFIVGLGIGMVLNAMALKEAVKKVIVIEKSPEIIELVSDFYQEKFGEKIEIICADIFEWKPPKEEYYDVVWFDIWDELCSDNLDEMSTLHRRFGKKAKWKGSWGKGLSQSMRRSEKRDEEQQRAFRMYRDRGKLAGNW